MPGSLGTQDPCGDQVEVYRVIINRTKLNRAIMREMNHWLVTNCGRPSRDHGFWWVEHGPGPGEDTVCFVLRDRFVEFSLRWV